MLIKIVDDDQVFAKKIKDIVYDAFKKYFYRLFHRMHIK